jgi:transaldolase
VNVTLIFSSMQAVFAAEGRRAVCQPVRGPARRHHHRRHGLIRIIVETFGHFDYGTEVLVASTRSPMHLVEAARVGADICTCPPALIEACIKHPLTDIGLEKFLKDWGKAQAARAIG